MSGTKKAKASAAKPDDEISQIMSEIEELQQEMKAEPAMATKTPKTKLSVVKGAGGDVTETPESQDPHDSDAALAEFRSGTGNDADLDATLGDLSDDGQTTGGLLDQVMDETVETGESTEPEGTALAEESTQESAQESTEEMTMTDSMNDSDTTSETGGEEGCLTMSLRGKMTLKLHYECGGQEVTVGFAEDCLKVQLADGTEFKVPVGRKNLRRVA